MSYNILITSISAKVPLIKSVIDAKDKFDSHMLVYGSDSCDSIVGKYFVDVFWEMPRMEELTIDTILNYCQSNDIRYIIPTRDGDVDFFSKIKPGLEHHNIYVFSSDFDAVSVCLNKLKFYEQNSEFNIIQSSNIIDSIVSDTFVVKEMSGSGSNNIAIKVKKNDAIKFSKKLVKPIFQPYIEGQEYSIDSYVNKNGKCIASIVRSRDVIMNGEAVVTTYKQDTELENEIKKFVEALNLKGHSVTQVIKQNKTYHIVECNPRFGGASTLSYNMGLKSFYWFFLECNNAVINFKFKKEFTKQIRIAKDIYLEC